MNSRTQSKVGVRGSRSIFSPSPLWRSTSPIMYETDVDLQGKVPLPFALGIDGLRLHCYCPVPWKTPWFILFILENHIFSLSRKVTGREIFLPASIADHLAFFSSLSWHGRSAVRMGEAGTNNKGKFIPEQKAQCWDLAEYINMQSRLIS